MKSKEQKLSQPQQKEETNQSNPQNKVIPNVPIQNNFPSNILGNGQASTSVSQNTSLGSSVNKQQATTAPAKQTTTASSVLPQISKYDKISIVKIPFEFTFCF